MNYHPKLREKYIEYANEKIKKRKQFYDNFKIINKTNNFIITKTYNYNNDLKRDYLYYNFVSKALNEKYYKKDFVAVFLTLTLASICHRYKKNKKNKFILNPKYDKNITIQIAYKILNRFFRNLYKNFRINSKYVSFDFVKVIEPHKDFTPHLHSIIYIHKSFLRDFLHFLSIQVSKNRYMGKYETEILNNISRANAYLLKYLQKSFKDNENSKIFLGWKLQNKIRVFTTSQRLLYRSVFERVGFSDLSKKFLLNIEAQDYFNTQNIYRYFSYVSKGKIVINDKLKEFEIDEFDEIPKKIYFIIKKRKYRKINLLYKNFIDTNEKLKFILNNKSIKEKFREFLFFKYNLSFSNLNKKELVTKIYFFENYLKKKLFRTYYKIIEYKIYVDNNLIYNKDDFEIIA